MPQTPSTCSRESDEWSEWLLSRRHGGDAAYQQAVTEGTHRIGDRVLEGAHLKAGMTLVDVGAGDGLIAFRALARVGASLRVIFTDISPPLLHHVEQLAVQRGVRGQCSFLQGTAEKLAGVADDSADVVTSRAVLAYVADKRAALGEFHRVLKPGGRISIAEPICQDQAFETSALGKLIAAQPTRPDIDFLRLLHRWKSAQFPTKEEEIWRNPMVNYSERDLVQFAGGAGFARIHLELHIDVRPSLVTTWEVFLAISLHPWAPTGGEILTQQFSESERRVFEKSMRPMIESGRLIATDLIAYLTAEKPVIGR